SEVGRRVEGRDDCDDSPLPREVGGGEEAVRSVVTFPREEGDPAPGRGLARDGVRERPSAASHGWFAGGEGGGFGVVDGGSGVSAQHVPSAMTKAMAIPASWEMDRCQEAIPRDSAAARTVPV